MLSPALKECIKFLAVNAFSFLQLNDIFFTLYFHGIFEYPAPSLGVINIIYQLDIYILFIDNGLISYGKFDKTFICNYVDDKLYMY